MTEPPPPRSESVPPPSARVTHDPAGPVVTRELEAISALRAMVVGAVGVLCGGAIALGAAYGLGGPFPAQSGAQRPVAMLLATAIAVLGGFTFVRGLVAREEQSAGADGLSTALVTLVTVPLAALALGGYAHTHPPDRQLRGEAVPYTFRYPGTWERNDLIRDGVASQGSFGYVTALSKRSGRDPGQGVLVVAFVPASRQSLIDWVRDTSNGAVRVANERAIRVAGHRGLMVDYEREPGKPFQSQAAFMRGDVAYVVTCFLELEPAAAREGCEKVLATFRLAG